MIPKWPNKKEREQWEIESFIAAYQRLAHGRTLVCHLKTEKPDYLLKDVVSEEFYGVELTSVYLNNRSVPDEHMQTNDGYTRIPRDHTAMRQYKKRLADAVKKKSRQAASGYLTDHPLILSVYVNEYISIHMHREEWLAFVEENEHVFNNMTPLSEVVFWALAGDGVLSIRSDPNLSVAFHWRYI